MPEHWVASISRLSPHKHVFMNPTERRSPRADTRVYRRYTRGDSFFAIRDDMEHAGDEWLDQEVVVDGNLITSRKPDDLPAFMRALISALS